MRVNYIIDNFKEVLNKIPYDTLYAINSTETFQYTKHFNKY